LALELAPYNINVNAVCPGIVDTPMWREVVAPAYAKLWGVTVEEALKRNVKQRIPLGRPQTPEDIGNIVVFLASNESENITGQSVNVDGGQHFS
jgi:NAD(P)-dependent dehydrogenase (short-subunit alcohol dehydrogenase family)